MMWRFVRLSNRFIISRLRLYRVVSFLLRRGPMRTVPVVRPVCLFTNCDIVHIKTSKCTMLFTVYVYIGEGIMIL